MTFKKTNPAKRKLSAVWLENLLFFVVLLLFLSVFTVFQVKAYGVGNNQSFLIDPSYDYNNRDKIDATLRKISLNAYFYVEDDYYNNLSNELKSKFDSDLNSLSENFDSVIYPNMKEVFGQEWSPGIDNDKKITILFTKTKAKVGGYFNPNDEYKKSSILEGKSNEREMIYLNAAFLSDDRVKSFLAHEFQHMITWYNKTKIRKLFDEVWINEARSEYASTAIGYDKNYDTSNLRARVKKFDSTDSLVEWQNEISDYSSVNLFAQYIADHFGKAFFKTMIKNDKVGIESVNAALDDLGYANVDFKEIFTNWTVANYLNDKTMSDGSEYGYLNKNLSYNNFHVNPTISYTIGDNDEIDISTSIKDWSVRYYNFKSSGKYHNNSTLRIDFDGQNSGLFSVPYIIFYDNGTKKVRKSELDNKQDSSIYIDNFDKDVSSVLVIPSSQKQKSDFGSNINNYSFSISTKMVKSLISQMYKDNSLLRSVNGEKVYLIEKGKKRWIENIAAFVSNGYKWEDVILVMQYELDRFENGENIHAKLNLMPNGSLIKGSGPKVYLVDGNKKRWITSVDVFNSNGYKWEDVVQIQDAELELYLEGENIRD